jgi:hypothetical protein
VADRHAHCAASRLAPVSAPYFRNANLLIAASCTAYAYANVHEEFMRGRVTLIAAKLDGVDYRKAGSHLRENEIGRHGAHVVPCCSGIVTAVKNAILKAADDPWHVVTLSTDGMILED